MAMPNPPTVCVITGATGHPNLKKCIESVQEQTYAMVQHLVVVDGPEWNERVDAILDSLDEKRGLEIIRLPHATGKNRWNGHRIYGAMPSIALTDYVIWMDEDNWFDPEHIESMVSNVMANKSIWTFALRKIVRQSGEFLMLDQCESLGNLHPTFLDPNDFHVDTNCYIVRRDVAIQLSGVWNRSARTQDGMGPDRTLCRVLMEHFPNCLSTGRYTVNYAVGNTEESAQVDFFEHGNQIMRSKYPDGLPWKWQEK